MAWDDPIVLPGIIVLIVLIVYAISQSRKSNNDNRMTNDNRTGGCPALPEAVRNFCYNCGSKLSSSSTQFCSNCGAAQS